MNEEDPAATSGASDLSRLLVEQQSFLARFVERNGGGVLRHESVGDLVHDVCVRVIEHRGRFEYKSDAEFQAWLRTVARNHITNRHAHWNAQKRRAGALLRITISDGSRAGGVPSPPASTTSPSTFSARKEEFRLAMRAISMLPERDRRIIEWIVEQRPVADIARELELSLGAAERARQRVIERFDKAFRRLRDGPG